LLSLLLNYKSNFDSSLWTYSCVIKRLEWWTSLVMSDLDIHHLAYPLLDASASGMKQPRRYRNQNEFRDHNFTLKSSSLHGDTFADNKIVRASLKAGRWDGSSGRFNSKLQFRICSALLSAKVDNAQPVCAIPMNARSYVSREHICMYMLAWIDHCRRMCPTRQR